MKKLLLSFAAIILGLNLSAQTADLRMNLEKNKVYRLSSTSSQNISQTINGNQQTTDSKVEYTASIKMIDSTPDFMITEVHIDTMKTTTNAMGKTSVMSSVAEVDIKSKEVADVMSCIMNRLSKNAIYVKIDFSGKPIQVINAKMLSDLILKDTSAITLTGPVASGIKKQIAGMISEDNLKTLVGSFTHVLPGRQVAQGDSWDINSNISSGGMMLSINTSFHLDGINGSNGNVTSESEIKTAPNAEPIISGPAKVTYDDLKGLSKSTMVIDTKTGLLLESKAKTHIAGNLGISAPGMTMTMPMDINGESKIVSIQ